MSGEFTHSVTVIAPVAQKDFVNQESAEIPAEEGGGFVLDDVLLSRSGAAPATHVACNTRCTDAGKDAISLNIGTIAGLLLYWEYEPRDALQMANMKRVEEDI